MANCTTFQNQLGLINQKLKEAGNHVDDFLANPAQYPNYPTQIAEIDAIRQKLLEDYQRETIQLLDMYIKNNIIQIINTGPLTNTLDHSTVEFEDSGRVIINDQIITNNVDYFPSIIRVITQHLSVSKKGIKSIDFLEEVGSISTGMELESMQRLRVVRKDAWFQECSIKHLDSLEEVGGDLVLHGSTGDGYGNSKMSTAPIESFKSLKRVGGAISVSETEPIDFPNLSEVEDNFLMIGANFKPMPQLKRIGGTIIMGYAEVESFASAFPALEEFGDGPDDYALRTNSEEIAKEVQQLADDKKFKMKGKIIVSDE